MKILMVISEAPPVKSGISRVADKLSKGLKKRGFHVDILSLNDIPRYEWGEYRFSSMPLKLGKLKDKFTQYDLIHLNGPVPTFSDVFLIWGLRGLGSNRPKLVYTHHAPIDLDNLFLRPIIKTYNVLQERLAQMADHVVVSTPSYGQRLSRFVPAEKLSVVPFGVDFDRFYSPISEKDFPYTVLYLGQIRPYKGLPVLLSAVNGMKDTRVWVIGNGHYAEACKQQANSLDIPDLTFWGDVADDNLVELIKKTHVIVMPSVTRSEAFGIALLEGMAAGQVPVASHLPGVADLVGNEGFTFPPGNDQALREILGRLKDDSSLRNHIATLAQAKARLYSWERTVFGYERIYSRLICSQSATPRFKISADTTTSPVLNKIKIPPSSI